MSLRHFQKRRSVRGCQKNGGNRFPGLSVGKAELATVPWSKADGWMYPLDLTRGRRKGLEEGGNAPRRRQVGDVREEKRKYRLPTVSESQVNTRNRPVRKVVYAALNEGRGRERPYLSETWKVVNCLLCSCKGRAFVRGGRKSDAGEEDVEASCYGKRGI